MAHFILRMLFGRAIPSAPSPSDMLQASDGKTRFVRLTRLLMCGGTTVMRELFDYIIPPANLPAKLSRPHVKKALRHLKNRRILTVPQWQKLYPPSGAGSVQSTSFDITLIFKLLREPNIYGLTPPSGGWDALPHTHDLSLPADMARIKYYRNEFAHAEKMELSKQEFNDYWQEIKDALMRIVQRIFPIGYSRVREWETAINKLLTDPLTEEDRKTAEELKSLYLESRLETLFFNVEKKGKSKGRLEMRESESFQLAHSILEDTIEMLREWFPVRESSITLMRKTADELDDIEKKVDKAKFYGSSTGLAGVALLGAGALVSFATAGGATPFLIGAGLTTTAGGGLVSGGADLTWLARNKNSQDRVKGALRNDFDKQKEVLEEVKVLQHLVKEISDEENISEEKVMENLLTMFLKGQNGAERADISPDQIKGIAQCVSSLAGVAVTFGAVLEISETVAVWSSVAAGVARGAIATAAPILAAIDAYRLYTTTERIAQGSRSEAAQKLRETANKLDEELHDHKDLLINIII